MSPNDSTLSTVNHPLPFLNALTQKLPPAIPRRPSGKDPPSTEDPLSSQAHYAIELPTPRSLDTASDARVLAFLPTQLLSGLIIVFWSSVFAFFYKIRSLLVIVKVQRGGPAHASPRSPILCQATRSSTLIYGTCLPPTRFKFSVDKQHELDTPLRHLRKDLQHPTLGHRRFHFNVNTKLFQDFVNLFYLVSLTHFFRQFLCYSVHDEGIMRSPPHLW